MLDSGTFSAMGNRSEVLDEEIKCLLEAECSVRCFRCKLLCISRSISIPSGNMFIFV